MAHLLRPLAAPEDLGPAGWTRDRINAVLGAGTPAEPVPLVRYDAGGAGRVVVCLSQRRQHTGGPGHRFNYRAALLTGVAIFGPALVVGPADAVEWGGPGPSFDF